MDLWFMVQDSRYLIYAMKHMAKWNIANKIYMKTLLYCTLNTVFDCLVQIA